MGPVCECPCGPRLARVLRIQGPPEAALPGSVGSQASGWARERCPLPGCTARSRRELPGWVVVAGAWRAERRRRGAEPAAGGAVPRLPAAVAAAEGSWRERPQRSHIVKLENIRDLPASRRRPLPPRGASRGCDPTPALRERRARVSGRDAEHPPCPDARVATLSPAPQPRGSQGKSNGDLLGQALAMCDAVSASSSALPGSGAVWTFSSDTIRGRPGS